MSGWTRRRTSAEVINATLLEVFLALVFVVFALAIFHQIRADAAEARVADAITLQHALSDARDSIRTLSARVTELSDTMTAARATIARLQFDSPYPPDCERGQQPPWVLTVTMSGPDQLTVVAHRPIGDMHPGIAASLTPQTFRSRFASVRAESLTKGCRYFVRVQDTPDMPKAGYKEAMAAISSVFRFRGAFQ